MHLYDGLITIIPINSQYKPLEPMKGGKEDDGRVMMERPRGQQVLGQIFHCRIEERTVLALSFLHTEDSPSSMPQLCILHQDSRGAQHMISHLVNLKKQQLHLFGSRSAPANTQWLKKSNVDGGSAMLVPVPTRWTAPPVAAAATAASAAAAAPSADDSVGDGGLDQQAPKQQLGGVVIIGQRQFTYCSPTVTKVLPVPQALFLTYESLPADPATGLPRFLLGDEFGNLHMLTLLKLRDVVFSLQLETLGSCALSSSLAYLGSGLVYVGSHLGDSQLVQVHDEPIAEQENDENNPNSIDLADTTYLTVVEEYTHLGPILDFDLIPTTPGTSPTTPSSSMQSQVVTASGSSKSGTLRLVRNGIGMNEYASVEIPGIQSMWSIRSSYSDTHHAYLVQSFVGETRVLGVAGPSLGGDDAMQDGSDNEESEEGGTLEEVMLLGLESSASTLYVGNVEAGNRLLQITESQIRLFAATTGHLIDSWDGPITVAAANEAGQIAVAMRGGKVIHFCVEGDKVKQISEKQMAREVSCLDLHPFAVSSGRDAASAMEVDEGEGRGSAAKSALLAVGLWDDFTVRLISLPSLEESLCLNLEEEEDAEEKDAGSQRRNRNNMMARSLSLLTLDFSPSTGGGGDSSSVPGVNMLFVGLGDGTLLSFAIALDSNGSVSARSKKEVCLGTQRIDLVPLATERGGMCILATGDRPTVIYLAGVGGSSSNQFNPKLCYSNVNLSASDDEDADDVSRPPSQQAIAVNVAAPFFSPLLFDVSALGTQHYSLCVADDSNLRLGVIDDIQKLHVTTCRLGMAPRRIVHCSDGRLFAVGCIESGIKFFGLDAEEANMGNCIRFMDDTTFDDIDRVDLEPYETILSMCYATLRVAPPGEQGGEGGDSDPSAYKPFLLVGTGYALPDEDEPTRGRILVYSFSADDVTATNASRVVRQVTEFSAQGGVYSICQFYEGKVLCTVNTKTMVCQLVDDTGFLKLQYRGNGHHGHILSLSVKSRATRTAPSSSIDGNTANMIDDQGQTQAATGGDSAASKTKGSEEKPKEYLAIVGDLMRSISLVQYYPEHDTLEEIARDFNSNWTTAIEMLTNDVYLGAENWNNLYCLKRNNNPNSSEEVRCRLETIGEYHLGEMCNKFMRGSLVMPVSSNSNSVDGKRRQQRRLSPSKKSTTASSSPSQAGSNSGASSGNQARTRRPVVVTGSQTLFGTVEGTLGVILGLDGRTAAFFATLERAMAAKIRPVGNLSHPYYRASHSENNRIHPSYGFVDGDLVETFLDLDRSLMEAVVKEMNRDGGWEVDDVMFRNGGDGKGKDGAAAGGGGGSSSDDRAGAMEEDPESDRVDLTVDDVLAMVEEMTMLH